MILKPAAKDDCRMLWEWVNDPEVRRSAFNQAPISFDDHVKWFHRKLNSGNCYIYIAYTERNEPIGQIRFDLKNKTAEIDVSVSKTHRGKGYAAPLIQEGIKRCYSDNGRSHFTAYIKTGNEPSYRAFEKAGFYFVQECIDGYVLTYDYMKDKK
ncbi:MAG: GNAT family N-acetyltransferase [Candidatus Omnitrophica bacterium]|nr:GNAT family N-acetyltransferase [Candidatus Omnitrophota bacterium]